MKMKFLPLLLLVLLPSFALAQGGLVQCGNPGQPACTFCDIWQLLDRIVKLLIQIAFAAGAIGIVVGGFFIMMAGGSESRVTKGREIITTAVVGVVIVLVAWVVLNSIFQFLAVGVEGWNPRFWNTIPCR